MSKFLAIGLATASAMAVAGVVWAEARSPATAAIEDVAPATSNNFFPVTVTQTCRISVDGTAGGTPLKCPTRLAGIRLLCVKPMGGDIVKGEQGVTLTSGWTLEARSERCYSVAGSAYTSGLTVFQPYAIASVATTVEIEELK